MGYNTNYEITLSQPVAIDIPIDDGYETVPAGATDHSFECKWYERHVEMAQVSKNHPAVLFTITGQGDELSDHWREYWRNGRVQSEKPSFAEFDEAKLSEPKP